MDHMTTKQAAEKWRISDRRVLQFRNAIGGAEKMGNTWLIPKDAEKPMAGRPVQAKKLSLCVGRFKDKSDIV